MRCNEWEVGEFVIPSKQWTKFKSDIRTEINEANAKKYEMALNLYGAISTRIKSDRKGNIWDFFDEECKRLNEKSSRPFSEEDIDDVMNSILSPSKEIRKFKLTKPKKLSFPKYDNNTNVFVSIGAQLSFNNEGRSVLWSVKEGNKACLFARDSVLGKALFRALNKIEWDRGTGGKIIGNDEYNRESTWEGGGGNYVKDTW